MSKDIKTICTAVAYAVHRKDESPIFGETVTRVEADDEGAGPFIVLTSNMEEGGGKVKVDLEELEAILVVARKLVKGIEEAQGSK